MIGDEPELEFFDLLPTTWDETKVIAASIGQYAMIARRKGDHWFVGAMNSGQPRTLPLSLDFLTQGKQYIAHLYSDDPSAGTATKVRVDRQPVDSTQKLSVKMTAQGGQAIRLEPVD